MGFSWSLFFAQSAHETIVEKHASMTGGDRLTDFAPGRRLKSGGIARLQYVDNFAALGGDPASPTQVVEGVRQVMGTRGLLMRDHEDAGKGVAELLGHATKAIEGTISISPKRAWRLRDAMLHALRLRNLSGMALEVILGHAWGDDVCCQCLGGRTLLCRAQRRLSCGCQCDENLGMLRFSCR